MRLRSAFLTQDSCRSEVDPSAYGIAPTHRAVCSHKTSRGSTILSLVTLAAEGVAENPPVPH
jgi:hypothetical protein